MTETAYDPKMPLQARMRFAFDGFLILLFAFTTYQAWSFATLARYLPLTVSVLALTGTLLATVFDVVSFRRSGIIVGDDAPSTAALSGAEVQELATGVADSTDDPAERERARIEAGLPPGAGDADPPGVVLRRCAVMFAWILGYIALIAVVGIVVASAVFLLSYLFLEAKVGWKIPVIGTILIMFAMYLMATLLNLEWPDYVLESTWNSIIGAD